MITINRYSIRDASNPFGYKAAKPVELVTTHVASSQRLPSMKMIMPWAFTTKIEGVRDRMPKFPNDFAHGRAQLPIAELELDHRANQCIDGCITQFLSACYVLLFR